MHCPGSVSFIDWKLNFHQLWWRERGGVWRLYCNPKRLEGAWWGGVRPLDYFGEGARPLVYFLEGAWFFSSLHDIGARPLPKIPEGARPLPEILEGARPLPKIPKGARPLPEILEGAWCQRRRQSFSVRRAWTWRWPRQCPWSPLSPLVNWHQAELATGGEGREGG